MSGVISTGTGLQFLLSTIAWGRLTWDMQLFGKYSRYFTCIIVSILLHRGRSLIKINKNKKGARDIDCVL